MTTAQEPMNRKDYEDALGRLEVELCALQDWVKAKGLRVVVVFEGRDAAGKGGAIRAITHRVSPRVFRVVALPVPSDSSQGWRSGSGPQASRAERAIAQSSSPVGRPMRQLRRVCR